MKVCKRKPVNKRRGNKNTQCSQKIVCTLLIRDSKLRFPHVLCQNGSSTETVLDLVVCWFGLFGGFLFLHAKQLLPQLLVDKNEEGKMRLCRTHWPRHCNLTTISIKISVKNSLNLSEDVELQSTCNLYGWSVLHFHNKELQYNSQLSIFRLSSVGTSNSQIFLDL